MTSFRKLNKLNKNSSDAIDGDDQSGVIYEKMNQIKDKYKEDIKRRYSKESFKASVPNLKCPSPRRFDNRKDEGDGNEHDGRSTSQRSARKRRNSVNSQGDTPLSRKLSLSILSSIPTDDSYTPPNEMDISTNKTQVCPSVGVGVAGEGCLGQMNFIMWIGLFAGLLVTKMLELLQLSFEWVLNKIMVLRNALLGGLTIWQFMYMEDNSHTLTKWLLPPFIGMCSLLYGFIMIFYMIVQFLLMATPKDLSNYMQKLCF